MIFYCFKYSLLDIDTICDQQSAPKIKLGGELLIVYEIFIVKLTGVISEVDLYQFI